MRVLLLWAQGSSPNLGVRVLAAGTAALVKSVHPDAEVSSQNYGSGPAPANVGVPRTLLADRLLDRKGLRSWIREFDYVVDTRAGDSFADIYGVRRLNAMSAMAEFVTSCGVPLVMGPQTIGPFTSRRGELVGRWSLRRADKVIARDAASAQAAAKLGRAVDALSTDVVFALGVPQAGPQRDVLLNVSGLLWTGDAHGSSESYQSLVRALIGHLRSSGRQVTLLSHVLDSDFPDSDSRTVAALGEELGLEHLIPESLDDARATMRGANLVIGSRMHACLNALSVGTPAIPLAYSRKFAPLLDAIQWPHVVSLASDDAFVQTCALLERESELEQATAGVRATAEPLLDVARSCLRDVA